MTRSRHPPAYVLSSARAPKGEELRGRDRRDDSFGGGHRWQTHHLVERLCPARRRQQQRRRGHGAPPARRLLRRRWLEGERGALSGAQRLRQSKRLGALDTAVEDGIGKGERDAIAPCADARADWCGDVVRGERGGESGRRRDGRTRAPWLLHKDAQIKRARAVQQAVYGVPNLHRELVGAAAAAARRGGGGGGGEGSRRGETCSPPPHVSESIDGDCSGSRAHGDGGGLSLAAAAARFGAWRLAAGASGSSGGSTGRCDPIGAPMAAPLNCRRTRAVEAAEAAEAAEAVLTE